VLGFRLTGGSLISIANINPSEFDTSNPGTVIFGWETLYPDANNHPEGIEANCTGCSISNPTGGGHATTIVPGNLNEMFVAMGSAVFTTAGPKPFLQIVATGPGSNAFSSTLQWLGAYNGGKGRISQISGGVPGGPYSTTNYDIFSGSATQAVPEPTSLCLILLGSVAIAAQSRRRPTCA
jgi:hypothetical protein